MKQIHIDIEHISYSRYGAMLNLSKTPGKNELIVHDVQKHFGGDKAGRIIAIPEGTDINALNCNLLRVQ